MFEISDMLLYFKTAAIQRQLVSRPSFALFVHLPSVKNRGVMGEMSGWNFCARPKTQSLIYFWLHVQYVTFSTSTKWWSAISSPVKKNSHKPLFVNTVPLLVLFGIYSSNSLYHNWYKTEHTELETKCKLLWPHTPSIYCIYYTEQSKSQLMPATPPSRPVMSIKYCLPVPVLHFWP